MLGLLLSASAFPGVDVLNCTGTDEKGNQATIKRFQSGHASNQYAGTLNGFDVSIHQLGSFIDEEIVPEVSIRIEKGSESISSFGRTVSTPDGTRFVEGPKWVIGDQSISVEFEKKKALTEANR